MFRQIGIMGVKHMKAAALTLTVQLMQLRRIYGSLIVDSTIKDSVLSCTILLTPSTESETYTVLITYKLSDYSPRSWMIKPALELYHGKEPEHIYGFDSKNHPRLCVYDPRSREWNQQMFIANTYVPWIVTWLNTYEYWQITGEWFYPAVSHCRKKA